MPIQKLRVRQPIGKPAWWWAEADGFYAQVSILNGDDNEVVGAILDSSVPAELELRHGVDVFANLRYLGGGSVGTNDDATGPGDGDTRTWLAWTSRRGRVVANRGALVLP